MIDDLAVADKICYETAGYLQLGDGMKSVRFLTAGALIGTLVVAGCQTYSAQEWATTRTVLQGSPKLRATLMQDCVKMVQRKFKTKTPTDVRNFVNLMNTSEQAAPQIYCKRFITAMTNGRLNEKTFNGKDATPEFVKILQGR